MKCKLHPKYTARYMPRKTTMHPDGCPTCWGIWEDAKTNKKYVLNTVTIEMSYEEARRAVLALDLVLARGGVIAPTVGPSLRPILDILLTSLRLK